MNKLPRLTKARFLKGVVALILGCVLNYSGDRLLGVQIELFRSLQDFGGLWMLDVLVLPFFVGLLVAVIFGLGGKWLCYFPPLIVKSISYIETFYISGVPEGASLLPFGLWGMLVIVVMTVAAVGGVTGEIMIKGTYGRSPRHIIYKERSSNSENDSGV